MPTPTYISIADILQYWQDSIAPNYFDFDNANNYRAGTFGYINEVMANSVEDTHNAVNIARREFYPVTAKNKQSFFKMATLQQLDLPMVTPAICKAFLVIPQREIVSPNNLRDGVYTCVIDNTARLMVGDIPFMLDYPIVIISKKIGNGYSHTSHYDLGVTNSLSTTNSKYIMNRITSSHGVNYLSLGVVLRQVEMESISQLVTKDSNIDIVSMEFNFNGNLANFEVYYSLDGGSTEIPLKKVLYGARGINSPYIYYTLIGDNTIQLTFPKNAYFTPAINSEVRMEVFTSLGDGGNFNSFDGDIIAQISSEKYPYNNTMTITGRVNGKSFGGQDRTSDPDFYQEVGRAYSTNNTITTSHDLQLYFNNLGSSPRNRMLFRKKRDDPMYRIFGAYSLMKDTKDNVIPTNTVNLSMFVEDFDIYTSTADRAILKPGALFEYEANLESGEIVYSVKRISDKTIMDDLDIYDDNSRFVFTNPFLIAVTFDPNVVGFYLNSINNSCPIEYSYVNDQTYIQFIGSAVSIERNPVLGSNYYKFSITVAASTPIDNSLILIKNDPSIETNMIRATMAGKLISCTYIVDHVIATLRYTDLSEQTIDVGNYSTYDIVTNTFTYHTGHKLNINVGDEFIANDILAVKCDQDLGKIRLMGDIDGILTKEDMYIPFVLENGNIADGIYTFSAYLSTNDYMTLDAKMSIESGIFNKDGTMNTNVLIPMSNLKFKVTLFYRDESINYSHIYNEYPFYENYTMTNTYTISDPISLIQQIDFIRSTLTYMETEINGVFKLRITEVPMTKANWLKGSDNFKYLVDIIRSNYNNLMISSHILENNFGIDFKFFNTFGKSRFYRVGIKDTSEILDSVNCSFKFGVCLATLTSTEVFISKFRTFVKEYIESLNDVNNTGHSIYIMNLIAALKTEFSEISYTEYYGMNSYGHEVQKIESLTEDELDPRDITTYIPEFINIYSYNDGLQNIPKIDITLLDP